MPLPSIRERVTRTLFLSAVFWGALMTAAVWWVIGHEIDELMDHRLRESAEMFQHALAIAPDEGRERAIPQEHAEYEDYLVWQLIDRDNGAVLRRSHKAPAVALRTEAGAGFLNTADGRWRLVTLDFDPAPNRFLLVAQSEWERSEARAEATLYTLGSALLMGILAYLLANWRLHRELRPLNELSSAVQRYDPLLPGTAPDSSSRAELAPIEQAVRDLGQRLALRIVSERAFTAHAAHALRTPLAGMDAQLAIALKEAPVDLQPRLRRIREAATRLSRVMQALLTMFRSGIEPARQAVTLAEVLAPLPFDPLRLEVVEDAPLHADPDLMSAVLMNLLDNALRHHARCVRLGVTAAAGWNRLWVQDDGEGCAGERLQRLRDALDRQDYGSGSQLRGLGLILADLVARAHHGRLELRDVDEGFRIELSWPILG
ncbi:MAG: HAMP domain-containing histidine kinase [Betaproteobacteria bacterium]|nr:MAG: HAMP domain-containing histidine kinase [Betaproteobacteria bacterium]